MALTNPRVSDNFNYKVAYKELLKGMEDLKAENKLLKSDNEQETFNSYDELINEFKSYLEDDINTLRKTAKEKDIKINSKATAKRILTEIFYEMF